MRNVCKWAFPVRPLGRLKAAGRLLVRSALRNALERLDLVGSGRSAFGTLPTSPIGFSNCFQVSMRDKTMRSSARYRTVVKDGIFGRLRSLAPCRCDILNRITRGPHLMLARAAEMGGFAARMDGRQLILHWRTRRHSAARFCRARARRFHSSRVILAVFATR
jgi:hypothetical protein